MKRAITDEAILKLMELAKMMAQISRAVDEITACEERNNAAEDVGAISTDEHDRAKDKLVKMRIELDGVFYSRALTAFCETLKKEHPASKATAEKIAAACVRELESGGSSRDVEAYLRLRLVR